MDSQPKPISDIFSELHDKFGRNLNMGATYLELAEPHECRARMIRHAGQILSKEAVEEHQKLISSYFDEIFGDMVCSLYFFYTGLDVPGRMVLRRALELSLVSVSYWDSPAAFWAWNSKNKDISFTELEEYLSGPGYARYLEAIGCLDTSVVHGAVKELRRSFAVLSNVVHPKPYNFETISPGKFIFFEPDLQISLNLLKDVQIALLKILLCRFPEMHTPLIKSFPNLSQMT